MPRTYPAGPLAEAIANHHSTFGMKQHEIVRSMSAATGFSRRQLVHVFREGEVLTEKTVDCICCYFLRTHISFVYGDYYFGDRIEKYTQELDEELGKLGEDDFCNHDWVAITAISFPEGTPSWIRDMLEDGEIELLYCSRHNGYTHAKPVKPQPPRNVPKARRQRTAKVPSNGKVRTSKRASAS